MQFLLIQSRFNFTFPKFNFKLFYSSLCQKIQAKKTALLGWTCILSGKMLHATAYSIWKTCLLTSFIGLSPSRSELGIFSVTMNPASVHLFTSMWRRGLMIGMLAKPRVWWKRSDWQQCVLEHKLNSGEKISTLSGYSCGILKHEQAQHDILENWRFSLHWLIRHFFFSALLLC